RDIGIRRHSIRLVVHGDGLLLRVDPFERDIIEYWSRREHTPGRFLIDRQLDPGEGSYQVLQGAGLIVDRDVGRLAEDNGFPAYPEVGLLVIESERVLIAIDGFHEASYQ